MEYSFYFNAQFWLVIGLICLILEVFTVSFYLFFFGIGALVTAAAVRLGYADAALAQVIWFSVVSVTTTLLFRNLAVRALGAHKRTGEYREFIGDKVTVVRAISNGRKGRVSYRGTEWTAQAATRDGVFEEGEMVSIVGVNGGILILGND